MKRYTDIEGNEIQPPSDEQLNKIIRSAELTLKQDSPNDHPCEFYWAEQVLILATALAGMRHAELE